MAAFTEQTNNLAPGRCATALAIFAQGRGRLRQAPFEIGQRVLWKTQPWLGAQTVTAIELISNKLGTWWNVTSGFGARAYSICSAEDLIAAPADWADAPAAPLFPHKLDPADFGIWGIIKARDINYQAQLKIYRRAYAAWAAKHLRPLGYLAHVARAFEAAELEAV